MSEYGREDWSKITANPIIDWGKLTSNYESVLSAQEESRIAQRQKIDEDASAGVKNVQDYSAGNNQNINTALYGASNAATSLIKTQYDLVKKGLADPRQFQLMLKNAQDSFTNLKKVGDTWNQRALDLEKRTNAGDNSNLEIEKAQIDGGLAQFKNVKMIPDATGTMYIYRIKDDGSVDTSHPAQSADALLNPANTRIDKVKVDTETAPIAKNIADWTTNQGETLGLTLEDARNHPQYKAFVDGAANNILSTNIRMASVLSDSLGYKAAWTEEEHKKNPDAIYMKSVNGVLDPEITPAQKKVASDFVKATLDSQVKHIENQKYQLETPTPYKETEAQAKARSEKETGALNYGLYVKLASGGDIGEQARNSINNSLPNGTQITKIDRNNKQMVVTVQDADGKQTIKNVILTRNGKPLDNVDVAQQLYGLTNPTNVIERDRLNYIQKYGKAGATSTNEENIGAIRPIDIDLMRNKYKDGKTYTEALHANDEAEKQVDIYSDALDKTGLDPSLYNISHDNNIIGKDYVIFKDANNKEVGRIEEDESASEKKAKFNRIVQRLNNPKSSSSPGSSKETPQQRAARIANQK